MLKVFVTVSVFVLMGLPAFAGPDPSLPAPVFPYQTTWFGNTFGGKDWVQHDAIGLGVSPDGTCFVPATWDEAQRGIGIYKDGKTIGSVNPTQSSLQGAAAVDGKYAFIGSFRFSGSVATGGLCRYTLAGNIAPWHAAAVGGAPGPAQDFLAIGAGWQSGAALGQGVLYATDSAANKIRVFDENTMMEQSSFACQNPWKIAVNGDGHIWVLSNPGNPTQPSPPSTITEFTPDGNPTGKSVSVMNAAGICFDHEGRLLVAGPNSQIVKYDVSSPAPTVVGSLGLKGGVWGGTPGANGPYKLLDPLEVRVDAADNIYVVCRRPSANGDTDLRKFSASGVFMWQLLSTEFQQIGDVDPASNGTDIYTRDSHYVMDYSKPAGKQWTWKGYTIDQTLDDVRLDGRMRGLAGSMALIRRLHGKLFLYCTDGTYLSVFRKGPGELFLPSVLISGIADWADVHNDHYPGDVPPGHPVDNKRFIWTDTNGNGKADLSEYAVDPTAPASKATGVFFDQWVDEKGTVWIVALDRAINQSALWSFAIQGFDRVGNPIYTWASGKRWKRPDGILAWDAGRIEYHADTDSMYIAAPTPDRPHTAGPVLQAEEILRYDHWSTGNPVLVAKFNLPVNDKNGDMNIACYTVCGRLLFAVERYLSQVHIFDNQTGRELGEIFPGPEVEYTAGWNDLGRGVRAFQRASGGYLVIAEEDYRAKQLVYRIPPEGVAAALSAEAANAKRRGHQVTNLASGVAVQSDDQLPAPDPDR